MNKFERCEKKYLLPKETYQQLINPLLFYLKEDLYPKYTIYNLYLDNHHFDLISRSLEKPKYKEKVRIRRYNDGELYIELKKKYNGIVYKRRTKYPIINTNQIEKEIQYTIQHYKLKPMVYIAYDRIAYVSKEQSDLRITFDFNLRYRFTNLSLDDHPNNQYYFQDDMYIMEIKIHGGMPLWLTHLLNDLKIYPTSFSKYGKIYEKEQLLYV